MALSVGDLVGNKYRILKRLGRGGLGDVYLAENQLLGRKVAIKHLRPGSVREQTDIERFLAEARTIARIHHENVLAIHDAIEEGEGNYYLVMEYADEGTVADLLQREGRLPVLQALELGLAVARALDVARADNILHGDIKPSNILLVSSRDGVKAKLADFGLSRVISEAKTDIYSGSFLYSAPEQLVGETVDHRADLYSLGATLYEMVAGQPPFPYSGKPEDVMQALRRYLEEPPVPPSQLNPDVSPAVDKVVLKALRKAPDERYPDAWAMGQALHQAMETYRAWHERVQTSYAQGVEHEKRGEWWRAIACYKVVVADQPGYAEAQERLAQVQERRDWEARYREGLQACDQGEWAGAEKCLSQVVAHDEGYADGDAADKLSEARRQLELGRVYEEAKSHETEERWSEAANLYIKILSEESDYKDAPAQLAHAVEQQKRQALYNSACEHLENRAWAEAVKTLQELERREPGYKDSAALLTTARRQKRLHDLYTQGARALNGGEWASAIKAFSMVLRLDPEYRDAAVKWAIAERQEQLVRLYERARAQVEAEEWANAVETLQEIKEIAPSYRDIDRLLEEAVQKQRIAGLYEDGVRFYKQEKWEQAIRRLEQVQRLQPGYRDVEQMLKEAQEAQCIYALYAQARQFEVEEKWAEAMCVYSDVIELDPNHGDAKVGWARVSAAALGRGQISDTERRERGIAIVVALLIIVALSYTFFAPISRMAVAIFLPTTTPVGPVITPTLTISVTPPASAMTPAVIKTPSPTPSHTPSPTPTPMTHTPLPKPTRTPMYTPVPPTPPELVAPTQGSEYKNPITFRWHGSLSADQGYWVTVYHVESGYTIQSGPLTDRSWIADLPGDKHGEWRWTVSVVQGGRTIVTSPEWMFWFNPFLGTEPAPVTAEPSPTPA